MWCVCGGGGLRSMGPFVLCKHGRGKCLMGSKGSPAGYERDQSYLEISGTLAKLFGCLAGLEASLAG